MTRDGTPARARHADAADEHSPRTVAARCALDGRVAVVTGGGRGIGRVIAERLYAAGACVVIADVAEGLAERAALELGDHAKGWEVDITVETDVERLVAEAIAAFGPIDILVNNAALTGNAPEPVGGFILDIGLAQWRRVLDVNLTGAFICSRAAGRGMVERGMGTIVNISSIQGLYATRGSADYSVSKAALIMLTKCLAGELGPFGVRVNAVAPGPILDGEERRELESDGLGTLLGRGGSPREVADAVIFLTSDAAAFIDGEVIAVDGGSAVRFRDPPRRV